MWSLLVSLFSIDLRALAAVRIGLGGCVLADLFWRAGDLRAFYSDAGLLPRADLLASGLEPFATIPSLLLGSGSVAAAGGVFVAAAVAALSLLLGYRARSSAALVWFLVTAIHLRNPLILSGVDPLLRLVPLWLSLTPCGACWSLDAARLPKSFANQSWRWIGAGGVGLCLQVFVVYFVAGVAKAASPAWVSGEGLAAALHYQMLLAPLGGWLAEQTSLLPALNWFVLVLEVCAPFLFFVPGGLWPLRVVAVVLLWTMHAAIFLTLKVGFFSIVPVFCLMVVLPSPFWDRLVSARPARTSPRALFSQFRRSLFLELIAASIVAWVAVWNVGLFYDEGYRPPEPLAALGDALGLQQKWGMFTELGPSGRVSIPGTLDNGATIDLLAEGGPLPSLDRAASGRPLGVTAALDFKNIYWRVLFLGLLEAGDERRFTAIGRYYCREFNAGQGPGLETLLIQFEADAADQDQPGAEIEAVSQPLTLWVHRCFG